MVAFLLQLRGLQMLVMPRKRPEVIKNYFFVNQTSGIKILCGLEDNKLWRMAAITVFLARGMERKENGVVWRVRLLGRAAGGQDGRSPAEELEASLPSFCAAFRVNAVMKSNTFILQLNTRLFQVRKNEP